MDVQRYGISLRVFLSISHARAQRTSEISRELNTRREIPYLQATMHYLLYCINIYLTRRSRLQKESHSFMVLNRASYKLAADWLAQTHVWLYGFSQWWKSL